MTFPKKNETDRLNQNSQSWSGIRSRAYSKPTFTRIRKGWQLRVHRMTDPEKTTQIPSKPLGQLLSGDLREGRCRQSEGYNLGGFNIGESAGFWLRSCNTPVTFSQPYISRSGAAIKARPEFNSFYSYDNAGYIARGSGLMSCVRNSAPSTAEFLKIW